ncbi:transcription regulator HTH, apses-type DNA-binding domain-containing protein [Mycotypha africana]|uniref:transcription regulator HTH, apses-type DNA-binding domain-containing protein n=1 Tax=Mycotypha africana TaxID=64632 RepID=UPI002300A962|nr:transcription regulator HTH, apses-type DNA-binding domain-containing protein [Mycotypha africana]KAI8987810.1 transcription regulator HTH, apses-type DNA-binding domain-containing protein [Mycotypha africana]
MTSSSSTAASSPTTTVSTTNNLPRHNLVARPKLTTTLWEDEGTICYQVDANGICVARRQDNDMINGTKLLNVAGMSRGKRDGILKNEKGRVVVKVGAMHLKGVWITFARAKLLAAQHKIQDILYPLFVDDPSVFLYSTAAASLHAGGLMTTASNRFNNFRSPYHNNNTTATGWSRLNDPSKAIYRQKVKSR